LIHPQVAAPFAVLVASVLLATSALAQSAATAATAASPGTTALDMLFEKKHLGNLEVGQKLTYRFTRDPSKPELLGLGFSDDITVDIKKVATDGTREVDVRVYTGDRARDPQIIDGLTGNPILVVFLDRSVSSYMAVAGGKVPYLKERFRSALRDRPTLEPVKVKLGDKTVDATRITIQPYVGDPNASKMLGFENSKFSIVVSEAVPGHFIELVANIDNSIKDAPKLVERIVMAGAEVVK
jgi:hypothetical protein